MNSTAVHFVQQKVHSASGGVKKYVEKSGKEWAESNQNVSQNRRICAKNATMRDKLIIIPPMVYKLEVILKYKDV